MTTLEAKSGYGLDRDTELRLVRVAREAGRQQPVRVVPTFLGAHVVPPEFKEAGPAGLRRFPAARGAVGPERGGRVRGYFL